MTNEFLFDAMSEIDSDLIERAEAPVPIHKKPVFRAMMIAAAIALVLTLGAAGAGTAGVVTTVKYVEQNYPEYDGTVLHFAQILLTEDENAVSSLLGEQTRRALGGFIEALRKNRGGADETDGESTATHEEQTREPDEQTSDGAHETEETLQTETDPALTEEPSDGEWSEGLTYRQRVEDGRIVYVVTGRGTCTDTYVRIPPTYNGDAVVAIGDSAFENDQSIAFLAIPSSVTEIGARAFRYCHNLQTVELTKGLGSIGQYAFADTTKLKEIEFPGSLGFIGDEAFSGAGLEQIVLPDSVTYVGQGAFANCLNAKILKLSGGMTEINVQAFMGCVGLTKIEIHEGIEVIRSAAFYSCIALEKVILPDRPILIENSAFSACGGMADEFQIEIPGAAPDFGTHIFNGANVKTFVFPDGAANVSDWMFSQCLFLESVTLPDSVTSIGDNAFYLCSRLREIRYCGTSDDWERIQMSEQVREQLTPLVVYVEEQLLANLK